MTCLSLGEVLIQQSHIKCLLQPGVGPGAGADEEENRVSVFKSAVPGREEGAGHFGEGTASLRAENEG